MRFLRNRICICLCLLTVLCIFIQGCSKNDVLDNKESIANKNFQKTTTDIHITPDYLPSSNLFALHNGYCYFTQETVGTDESEIQTVFYRKKCDESTNIEKITEIDQKQVMALDISFDDLDHPILCAVTYNDDKWELAEYDGLNGAEIKSQVLDITEGMVVTNVKRVNNNSYLLYNNKHLFYLDKKGELIAVSVQEDYKIQNILVGKTGKVQVFFFVGDSLDCYMSEFSFDNKSLIGKKFVPGNGFMLCEDETGKIYTLDMEKVYGFSYSGASVSEILDTSLYHLTTHKVRAMEVSNEVFRFLYWNGDKNSPTQLIEISEKELTTDNSVNQNVEEYDADGRRIITLYDPYGMFSNGFLDSFNENNDMYTLVVETGNTQVQTVLAGKHSPDLMLHIMGNTVEQYQRSGYLEDLYPYIEQSKTLSIEDILPCVIDYFTFEDGLYALSRTCTLETLHCLPSQLQGATGWTMAEFLNWLQEHRDLKSEMGLGRDKILDYCLKGSVNKFIDFDSRTASFDTAEFKTMLAMIKQLDLDAQEYMYEPFEDFDISGTRLFDAWITDALQLSQIETVFGEQTVQMGYPSADGLTKTVLECNMALSILKNSSCKEGAYAVIEHYLTYCFDTSNEASLWTYVPRFEKENAVGNTYTMSKTIGEGTPEETYLTIEFEITESQKQRLAKMLEEAIPDSYENYSIRKIIREEVQPFFMGDKELDGVCEIIQNRVQLYLDEQ